MIEFTPLTWKKHKLKPAIKISLQLLKISSRAMTGIDKKIRNYKEKTSS